MKLKFYLIVTIIVCALIFYNSREYHESWTIPDAPRVLIGNKDPGFRVLTFFSNKNFNEAL